MPASIWLQLSDEQEGPLKELIERLAKAHGTVPFQPHLTVCSPQSEAFWDAAAEYVRHSAALPLRVKRTRISFSTTAPMMAVVMYVEDTPDLQAFREDLRRLTGAVEPPLPHISLLYGVDETGRRPSWSSDEDALSHIAGECDRQVGASEFNLHNPVIVAPEGEWTNVGSWRGAHRFAGPSDSDDRVGGAEVDADRTRVVHRLASSNTVNGRYAETGPLRHGRREGEVRTLPVIRLR